MAQQLRTISVPDTTVFDIYTGSLLYQTSIFDTTNTPNGKAIFKSELFKDLESKELKKLYFNGRYQDGKKTGKWTFTEMDYDIEIFDISVTSRNEYNLKYDLSGAQYQIELEFLNGIPNGTWKIEEINIEKGKPLKKINNSNLLISNGIATGAIKYFNEHEKTEIDGTLDEHGFLDGLLTMKYRDSLNNSITEERLYKNGFLLRIIQKSQIDNDLLIIEYGDVVAKLDSINDTFIETKFTISDKGFGLLFDNGYPQNSIKSISQIEGNEIIQNFLDVFSRFLTSYPNEQDQLITPFTRRFYFDYADDPDELKALREKTDEAISKYSEFVNSARVKLYKDKSDTVAKAIALIDHSLSKVLIIDDVLNKIDSGYFDFRDRNNYYESGIPGLQNIEILSYKNSRGDTIKLNFDPEENAIRSNKTLISKLISYLNFLNKLTNPYKDVATKEINQFKEQRIIDEFDSTIVALSDSIYERYSLQENSYTLPFEQLNFDQKVYVALYKNRISGIKDDYLLNSEFEEKKALGEDVVCFLRTIDENQRRIARIGEIHSRLDSLFTVFEEHPFDNRLFESKVLGNIRQKGGDILYRYYLEELINTSRCIKIETRIEKIEKLLQLLEKMAKDYKNPEYIRLNRLIRRESQPARIERLLDLQNGN